MDIKKSFLLLIIVISGYLLWDNWQVMEAPKTAIPSNQVNPSQNTSSQNIASNNAIPAASINKNSAAAITTVKTPLLSIGIDQAGNVVESSFLQLYKNEQGQNQQLLTNQGDQLYTADSGLMESQPGPDKVIDLQYLATIKTPSTPNDPITVSLVGSNNVISVTKTYTLDPKTYLIKLQYAVTNKSNLPWSGYVYTKLTRTPVIAKKSALQMPVFEGGAYSIPPNNNFEKLSFADMGGNQPLMRATSGWVAMMQQYFVSAWIPSPGTQSQFYSEVSPGPQYTIGAEGTSVTIQPGETEQFPASDLYVGPATAKNLKAIPYLSKTVGYGWATPIASIIFWMMSSIHSVVGNWGWSIVLVTLLIKLIFYKLSATSYRSMGKMKKLQPKMAQLKERFGDDKQALNKAMMELYRTEKVNPLGGCLPILVQIPIFISLYYVLLQSVELRGAPFILWIHDLSIQDPYFVLPILMGLSMLLQQKLNPAPPDPMQAKMMMMLPVVFTVLFLHFPSGLVLYWLVNNIASILQQWFIMHNAEKSVSTVKTSKEK